MARTTAKGISIGELARRTGVSVKTLRYYSDEGLLPPKGRTKSGYRAYDDGAFVRLDLIRTLRDAGLSLERIRAVLARELSLGEALRMQLRAVEAHVVSLKQVASALRAALRSEPTEHDVRRLVAVTRLSNQERRAVIEGFYEKVSEGSEMDETWKQNMIAASAPTLPDDPSPEQLDAWIELSAIVEDPGFLESMKKGVKETWTADFDLAAYTRAADAMVAETKAALARGVKPEHAEAKRIVDDYLATIAPLMKAEPDDAFRRSLRERFTQQDPRASRYWELVAILRGTSPEARQAEWPHAEWAFFVAASKHHYP